MEEDCLPLHSENDEYIRALERVSESCAIRELIYITSDYNLSEIFWKNLRLYLYLSLSLPDRGDINTMWTLRGDVPQTGSQTGITSKSIQTATTTQNKFDQHICGNGSYHHTRIARGRLLRLHGHLDGLTAQSSTTGRHWNWNWVPWSRRISEKTFFSEENASFFLQMGPLAR